MIVVFPDHTVLLMLYEINASPQKLSTSNQKYDIADDDADTDDVDEADGDMIPMCRPCFAGNTNSVTHFTLFI